jgi:hypothetical protein
VRLFVLGPDLSEHQPVWLNIFWPHYSVMAASLPTTFLGWPPDTTPGGRIAGHLRWQRTRRARAPALCRTVRDTLDPAGPNLLIAWALNARHARFARLLDDVWTVFDHTILNVVDTLQPDHLPRRDLERFDLVTSFCGDLADAHAAEAGVEALHVPPHTDVLGFHSARAFRPVDLIVVGRRDKRLHAPLHAYFNAPGRDRIFLDFVTRTQMQTAAEEEFRLLMATYGRSKAAFCHEPSGMARFRGRSPLTGRWVHAWAAGCTVFGATPTGRGVASLTDWPEATIDLPAEPGEAIARIERILDDAPGLERRRRRNVVEALRRHDTRLRLRDLLGHLGITPPDPLRAGLDALEARARAIEAAG